MSDTSRTEDECMMQAWYETLDDTCKEYQGRCEECPCNVTKSHPNLIGRGEQ